MFNQLCLGPVLEPDEVDVLGEGRILTTHVLEAAVCVAHDQTHAAVVTHRPDKQQNSKKGLFLKFRCIGH